jgi:hypothetical protein
MRSLTYRQRDLEAAMKAALRSGFPVRKMYIDRDGRIVIVAGEPPPAAAQPDPELSEWDRNPEKI